MHVNPGAAPAPTCSEHVGQRAGWHCADCQRQLCPECAATTDVGRASYESCVHCDGPAAVLRVPGRSESFGELLVQSLRMPARGGTLLVLLGTWWWVTLLEPGDAGPWAQVGNGALGLGGWVLYVGMLQVSAKAPDLVASHVLSPAQEVVFPAMRLWGVSLLVLGALSWMGARAPWLTALLAIALGAAVAPYVILLASRGDGLRSLVSPREPLALVRALGRDAVRLSALFAVLLSCLTWWWSVGRSAQVGGFGAAANVLDAFVALGLLLSARLLGLLAAVRAGALGIPFREDLLVPALPGARARGIRRAPVAPVEPPPTRPRFLEL